MPLCAVSVQNYAPRECVWVKYWAVLEIGGNKNKIRKESKLIDKQEANGEG